MIAGEEGAGGQNVEGGEKAQTSSYKISESWRGQVQRGDNS